MATDSRGNLIGGPAELAAGIRKAEASGGVYGGKARAMTAPLLSAQKQGLGILSGLEKHIEQREKFGRQEIVRAFKNLLGARQQDLVSRGLTASTVASSVARGTERDRQRAFSQLASEMAQARMGLAQGEIGLLQSIGQTESQALQLAFQMEQQEQDRRETKRAQRNQMIGSIAGLGATLLTGGLGAPSLLAGGIGSGLSSLFGGMGIGGTAPLSSPGFTVRI